MNAPTKSTGIVAWFDDSRGFGFIENSQGKQVFFHHSAIKMDGYKRAGSGEPVKYIETKTDKGLQALSVEVYESNYPFDEDFSVRKKRCYERTLPYATDCSSPENSRQTNDRKNLKAE